MGKHRDTEWEQCRFTWGTCDVRSNQPPDSKVLPHLCGGNFPGHPGLHRCQECGTPQA